MSNNVRKKKTPIVARISPRGAAAIVVMGIFLLCIVTLVSKALFVSNSADVPAGIDTATISVSQSVPPDESADLPAAVTTAAPVTTTALSETTQTTTEHQVVKMKVLDVVYLKYEPDEDAENVIVMSPNIEVDVLEVLDNGWTKITFLNVTGQLTGYVQSSYLY